MMNSLDLVQRCEPADWLVSEQRPSHILATSKTFHAFSQPMNLQTHSEVNEKYIGMYAIIQ